MEKATLSGLEITLTYDNASLLHVGWVSRCVAVSLYLLLQLGILIAQGRWRLERGPSICMSPKLMLFWWSSFTEFFFRVAWSRPGGFSRSLKSPCGVNLFCFIAYFILFNNLKLFWLFARILYWYKGNKGKQKERRKKINGDNGGKNLAKKMRLTLINFSWFFII